MASTLSNLYVEKASSEHPLALWMLNEQVDYVSQITEDQRQFQLYATWQLENCEAIAESSTSINAPFPNSSTSRIIGQIPSAPLTNLVARSNFTLSNNLVADLFNFSIGFHIFFDTALSNSISFGYQYTDIATNTVVEVLNTELTSKSDNQKWRFFSHTFDLPPGPAIASNVKLLFKFNVSQGGTAGDYDFLINGLSIGQWSEDFNRASYGVTPSDMPSNIALPQGLQAIPAYPYGASGENGYYLSHNYELTAKNFGVPLVFGSSNLTRISPNTFNEYSLPSVIFPGYGFLNDRGRHNDYTVEMWLRINSLSDTPRKIFGPIVGTDGLYADGPYLTFKIGDIHGSHYVGEWFRPMLVHIRVLQDSAIIILNGEEVINLTFDSLTIDLPLESGIAYGNTIAKNQDWVGFWAYDDVTPVELDTFSIYSYAIPTAVAKRRWVWGQGVTSPEQTNSSINSITAYNDYAFANYASNYNYPDFANWKQAFYSNVTAGDKMLSLPEYKLPVFNLGARTTGQLFDDTQAMILDPLDIDDQTATFKSFLTLSPNSGWSTPGKEYLYFEKLGVLNEPVETVYGIFKTDGVGTNQTLVKIVNKYTGDFLSIVLKLSSGPSLEYSITIDSVKTVIASKSVLAGKKFTAGINLKNIASLDISGINRFFSDQSALALYLAGDDLDSSKFTGRVYKFGFDASYNNRKISYLYDLDGIMYTSLSSSISGVSVADGLVTYTTTKSHGYDVGDMVSISGVTSSAVNVFNLSNQIITKITDTTFTIENPATGTYTSGGTVTDQSNHLFAHTANYTLTAINKYGLFFADIAVAGYWEDYMPLSYFSKAVLDYNGDTNYELDSIQFNQDFPEPPASASSQATSIWTYSDLQIEYSVPNILTYADLNNAFYTKWANYLEMSQNSVKTSFYDTGKSALRSYVSFQYISDGANTNLVDIKNKYKALTSGILDPAGVNLDWQNTAYEVATGTVIYPPTKINKQAGGVSTSTPVDFNDLAIVYHLEFKSEGILHQQIKFKELQLASHVLERTDFTPVGSRFGIPVYYYTKSGVYYDLKAKNPIATYKKSTPYLYLNRQSGWKIRGEFNSLTDRGLAIPVNLSKAESQEVSSMQLWIRFAESVFPEDPIMIFSIEHNNGTYDFYIQADASQQRGRIFAVDRDSTEVLNTLGYYVNGQSVASPYMINGEWVVLGLEFPDLLDFSNGTGKVSLNGPLTYNNISYNLATNIEKSESLETRSWSDMLKVHTAGVTAISSTGTAVTYTVSNQFIPGEVVSISGVVPSVYNVDGAVVVSSTLDTITIASTATGAYSSGGTVKSGKWIDLKTDLVVSDGSVPPFAWQQVKVISQSRTFSIDPKAIYEKYTGSNRIVIDDPSSGILVKPEKFKLYNQVSWSDNIKIAV